MRTLVGILWLLAFTSALCAQVSTIRGGDHTNFTRITIENPLNSEWTVNQNEGRIEVRFDQIQKFDTKNTFSRITKDRVSKVTKLEKAVEIWLSCSCKIEYFQSSDGLIVVDISSEKERRIRPIYSNSSWKKMKNLPAVKDQVKKVQGSHNGNKIDVIEPSRSDVAVSPEEARSLNSLMESLPRRLSKQSTKGILSPNLELAPREEQTDSTSLPIQVEPSKITPNIRILSSSDEQIFDLPEELREVANYCKNMNFGPMHSWASSTNFSHQVSLARNDQVRNADGSMPDEYLRRLSRIYAYFGLMQEAASYISKDLSQAARAMKIVYEVVGDENITDAKTLQEMHDCGGELRFWANLAGLSSVTGWSDDIDELIHHFDKLPSAIKQMIGLRIVKLLNSEGWTDRRDYVKRSLALINENAHEEGPTDVSNIKKPSLLDEDYRKRMVKNILTKDPANFVMDSNDSRILESYLFELRGLMPESEREIIGSYLLAYTGQHISALRLALECRKGNSVRDCFTVRDDIRMNFVKTAPDEKFLLGLFQYPTLVFPKQSGSLRDHFEDRLSSFGLLEHFLATDEFHLQNSGRKASSSSSLFELDGAARFLESAPDTEDALDIDTDLRGDASLGDFRRLLRDGQDSRVKWEGKFESAFEGG